MASIFISYRRVDTEADAGRLYDSLMSRFPDAQIFMDIDSLKPGEDFVEGLKKTLSSAEVVLVIIGRTWLTATDAVGHRRLDDPNDLVHQEIARALDRHVHVIPVLVQGAVMPAEHDLPHALKSLARRQAVELRHGRWGDDVHHLTERIEFLVTSKPLSRADEDSGGHKRPRVIATAIGAGLSATALTIGVAASVGLWRAYGPTGMAGRVNVPLESGPAANSKPPETVEPAPASNAEEISRLRSLFADAMGRRDYNAALRLARQAGTQSPDDPVLQGDLDQLLSEVKRRVARGFQQTLGGSAALRAGVDYRNATRLRDEATRFEAEGRTIDAVQSLIAARQSLDRVHAANRTSSEAPSHAPESVQMAKPAGDPDEERKQTQPSGADTPSTPTTTAAPTQSLPPSAVLEAGKPRHGRGVATSPAAGDSLAAQRSAIEAVLDRYAEGYGRRDPVAIRRVWPSAPEGLARELSGVRSYRLEIVDREIAMDGDVARVTCVRLITAQLAVGRGQSHSAKTVISLQRGPAGWLITDVR